VYDTSLGNDGTVLRDGTKRSVLIVLGEVDLVELTIQPLVSDDTTLTLSEDSDTVEEIPVADLLEKVEVVRCELLVFAF